MTGGVVDAPERTAAAGGDSQILNWTRVSKSALYVIIGREKAPPALTSAHTPRYHSKTMSTTISSVALGLNGGCCFAYAVLFGVMQTRLLEMYGVEVCAETDRRFVARRELPSRPHPTRSSTHPSLSPRTPLSRSVPSRRLT